MFFKRLKKNKNKGFTLIELIVTFALFSIIGIGAMVLLIETSNIFHTTTKLNNVQNAVLVLTDTIKANMYGTEEAEFLDTMPDSGSRGTITDSGVNPEDYGYMYFNTGTGTLEKAIGSQPALGISMHGVSGLAEKLYNFEVSFSDEDRDDAIIIDVYVFDKDTLELVYNYTTSFSLHNLQYAADIAAAATAEDVSETTTAGTSPVEGSTTQTEQGHIGGSPSGGHCIKYRLADR